MIIFTTIIILAILCAITISLYYTNLKVKWWFQKHWEKLLAIGIAGSLIGGGGFVLYDPPGADSGWWHDINWDFCKKITFNVDAQISYGLSDFPMLVHIVDDGDLFGECQSNGNDILFTMTGNNETKLSHEIEYWNWDTGNSQVDAEIWVNVTSVSSSADTIVWMYYGNASASNQEDITGTWDDDYVGVWHMDGTTSVADSTSYANNGAKGGSTGTPTQATGKIGHCQSFVRANLQYVNVGSDAELDFSGTDEFTLEAWYKSSDTNSQKIFSKDDAVAPARRGWYFDILNTDDKLRAYFSEDDDDGTNDRTIFQGYGSDVSDNIWHHSVLGIEWGLGDDIFVYTDGALVNDIPFTNMVQINPNADGIDLWIGCHEYPTDGFQGTIDEARASKIRRNLSWNQASFHSANLTTGFFTLGTEQEYPTAASKPSITTDAVTGLEETNVTISGTLTDNGTADTTCRLVLSPNANMGSPIFNISHGVVANQSSFSNDTADETTLDHGAVYYYQAKGNNSEGWGLGSIISFITKPNSPTSGLVTTASDGSSWVNFSWTGATGADRYYARYSTSSTPTTRASGTYLCNVTTTYFNTTFSTSDTYYFSVWGFAVSASPALSQWSDSYTSDNDYLSIHTWYNASFGGNVTVTAASTLDTHVRSNGVDYFVWLGGNTTASAVSTAINDSTNIVWGAEESISVWNLSGTWGGAWYKDNPNSIWYEYHPHNGSGNNWQIHTFDVVKIYVTDNTGNKQINMTINGDMTYDIARNKSLTNTSANKGGNFVGYCYTATIGLDDAVDSQSNLTTGESITLWNETTYSFDTHYIKGFGGATASILDQYEVVFFKVGDTRYWAQE